MRFVDGPVDHFGNVPPRPPTAAAAEAGEGGETDVIETGPYAVRTRMRLSCFYII